MIVSEIGNTIKKPFLCQTSLCSSIYKDDNQVAFTIINSIAGHSNSKFQWEKQVCPNIHMQKSPTCTNIYYGKHQPPDKNIKLARCSMVHSQTGDHLYFIKSYSI